MMNEESKNRECNQAGVEEAQENAYELAHDAIVAATNGDEAGVLALLKVLSWELETILNKGHRSWTDSA
jgi:hypothetical protein